eukprot:1034481-Pelagomonas_calceolata.AAC.2
MPFKRPRALRKGSPTSKGLTKNSLSLPIQTNLHARVYTHDLCDAVAYDDGEVEWVTLGTEKWRTLSAEEATPDGAGKGRMSLRDASAARSDQRVQFDNEYRNPDRKSTFSATKHSQRLNIQMRQAE